MRLFPRVRTSRPMVALLALIVTVTGFTGCTTTGSINKAPVVKVFAGGSRRERLQEYTLKQVKSKHMGNMGRILGARYFTDARRPISGARIKDTLVINEGKHKGTYTISKVIRQRLQRRTRNGRIRVIRRVILKINEDFNPTWKTIRRGNGTMVKNGKLFTDTAKFLPEVATGTQVVLGTGETKRYTVLRTTVVKLKGLRLRVAYQLDPQPPASLQNTPYQLQVPQPTAKQTRKLVYQINWRGSQLTGHFFTIGINRRRYSQKEMEDLLKSNPDSKQELASTSSKQGAATVLRYTGALAIVVGGFLALVRRDDFQGAAQAIPWGIVGGGLLLVGTSIPVGVSANNDYLEASKAFNVSIRKKLRLSPKTVRYAKKKKAKKMPLVYTGKTTSLFRSESR